MNIRDLVNFLPLTKILLNKTLKIVNFFEGWPRDLVNQNFENIWNFLKNSELLVTFWHSKYSFVLHFNLYNSIPSHFINSWASYSPLGNLFKRYLKAQQIIYIRYTPSLPIGFVFRPCRKYQYSRSKNVVE